MPNMLGGRSLVSIGLLTPFVMGVAPAAAPVPFEIDEPGVAGVLVLPQTAGQYMTSLRLRGQELISGIVPFDLFSSDNPTNPLLGYAFDESTKIQFNAFDAGGAGALVTPTITATRMLSMEQDGISQTDAIRDEFNAFGRRPGLQLAIGPAAQTAALAAGASVTMQMVILRPGKLGFLHVSPQTTGLDVTSVVIQNDGIINGQASGELFNSDSFASPGFGHEVNTATIVTVTIKNNTAVPIQNVIACFTMKGKGMMLANLMDLRQGVQPNAGDLNMDAS